MNFRGIMISGKFGKLNRDWNRLSGGKIIRILWMAFCLFKRLWRHLKISIFAICMRKCVGRWFFCLFWYLIIKVVRIFWIFLNRLIIKMLWKISINKHLIYISKINYKKKLRNKLCTLKIRIIYGKWFVYIMIALNKV
jgi:hypothetical protein